MGWAGVTSCLPGSGDQVAPVPGPGSRLTVVLSQPGNWVSWAPPKPVRIAQNLWGCAPVSPSVIAQGFTAARKAAVLDEFRLDGDQDADRADVGVLRACELVGSGDTIRVPGPSALLTRNPLALVIGMPLLPH